MYDLVRFSLQDATDIGATLRSFGEGADSIETVSNRCIHYLYNNLIDPQTGKPACALARFFKTHSYGDLSPTLQTHASGSLSTAQALSDSVKCLTLLATVGELPDWNDRHASQGHQAIPLTSAQGVQGIPMIAQLIRSLGLEINSVVAPDPKLLMELERKTYNVFHIPEALGSKYIPGQTNFVVPFGIRSVLGIGGMLASGDLFTIILFTKVAIPETTARLFKTLPLNIKMSILPFSNSQIFCTAMV
ncbi:MAG: hypothetical protein AAF821_18355 [Cyanobacteria bacterium P01_D01_bin.156]